jgi:hypothetical protein
MTTKSTTNYLKAGTVLMNALSAKNNLPLSAGLKYLVLLNFRKGDYFNFKGIKKDMTDKVFKAITLQFFFTLQDIATKKSYKSKIVDSLDQSKLEFALFTSKATKLEINGSKIIDIKSIDTSKYKLSYNVVFFLQ